MADRIEELFLKKFTSTELGAGTRHDFTSNSTTAFALKDVEFSQGSDNDAISGSVTVGKTSDFSASPSKFSTLGTFGALVDSLSGTAIMDIDSTLSIRPDAKVITYTDETVILENGGTTNNNSVGPLINQVTPIVNGNEETPVKTTLSPTNAGTGNVGNYQSGASKQYAIVHTTANGIKVWMRFAKGTSAYSYVYMVGMDDGNDYAYLQSTYTEHLWDGERFIYWYDGGYIYFFDLDDANITNPTTHGVTCHGRMTAASYSGSSYDHKFGSYHVSKHDGKKYFYQHFNSQNYGVIWELPSTTADGAACPKRWKTGSGAYSTNGTDPWGNNSGSAWVPYGLELNVSRNQYSMEQMSTFTDKLGVKRWMLWRRQNSYQTFLFTWRDEDMQALSNNSVLGSNDPNSNSAEGLRCVALSSFSHAALDFNTTYFNGNSGNGFLDSNSGYLGTGNPDWEAGTYGNFFVDGLTFYQGNISTNYNVFKIDLTKTSFPGLFVTGQYAPYENIFYVQLTTPSQATIDARTYTKAPALTVRVTGVREDRT